MTQRNVSLTDKAYNKLKDTKGDFHNTSFSKVIIQLIQEHHELAKIKLEMVKKQPQETKSSPVIYTHIKDKKQKTRFEV